MGLSTFCAKGIYGEVVELYALTHGGERIRATKTATENTPNKHTAEIAQYLFMYTQTHSCKAHVQFVFDSRIDAL